MKPADPYKVYRRACFATIEASATESFPTRPPSIQRGPLERDAATQGSQRKRQGYLNEASCLATSSAIDRMKSVAARPSQMICAGSLGSGASGLDAHPLLYGRRRQHCHWCRCAKASLSVLSSSERAVGRASIARNAVRPYSTVWSTAAADTLRPNATARTLWAVGTVEQAPAAIVDGAAIAATAGARHAVGEIFPISLHGFPQQSRISRAGSINVKKNSNVV